MAFRTRLGVVGHISHCGLVDVAELDEEFADLPEGLDGDVIGLALEELLGDELLLVLLFGSVGLVADASPAGEGVVHGQFLLQLPDVLLVLLQQQFGV